MNIKTVLFDLDGTLIDTNELIIASFDYTFKQFDLSFTREELIEFNGPSLSETFFAINPERVEEMIQTYREFNISNHDDYVKIFPNVIETVEQLRNAGIQMGIVTTKGRKVVEMGLSLTKLTPYFETVITLDDVVHPKPHPEPVMKAMQQLSGEVSSTLMVGDNYHDIEAGHNAGIETAGVAWSYKGEDFLATYNPTYMLKDMKDLLKIVGV